MINCEIGFRELLRLGKLALCELASKASKTTEFENNLGWWFSLYAALQPKGILKRFKMSDQSISLSVTIPKDCVEQVTDAVCTTGGKASKATPANSASEALNAPLTGAEVLLAAQVMTCIFSSVAAAIQFLASLKELKKEKGAPIVVINIKTQEKVEVTAELDELRLLDDGGE